MILSAFFNKSKPINFMIVGACMVFFYGYTYFKAGFSSEFVDMLFIIVGLISYVFSMLGIDFVSKRNELCKSNTFGIVLFAVFTTMLPSALLEPKIVIASSAILLAVRRIVSLHNPRAVQKKILDASLWIMLASACYFWSILFFVVLFFGIGLHASQNYRNWLIPFVGLLASYVLVTCMSLFFWDHFFSLSNYISDFSLFFSADTTTVQWVVFGVVFVATVFFLVFYLLKYKGRKTKTKPAIILIVSVLLVAIVIALIASKKDTGELFFVTVPIAIMGTSYLESSIKPIVKEGVLWFLVLLPIALAIF